MTVFLYRRGWCCYEAASRADAAKKNSSLKPSVFVGDRSSSKFVDFVAKEWDFFRFMRTFDAKDRIQIQESIMAHFSSVGEFNAIIKEASREACKQVPNVLHLFLWWCAHIYCDVARMRKIVRGKDGNIVDFLLELLLNKYYIFHALFVLHE